MTLGAMVLPLLVLLPLLASRSPSSACPPLYLGAIAPPTAPRVPVHLSHYARRTFENPNP
ncbi:MAG: hypothetical protein AAFY26_16205 [Cyanobacteria bacterium J06638_22]